MSLPTMVFVFICIVFVYTLYSTKSLTNKLYVTYWNVLGDKEEIFVPVKSRYVIIHGKRYNILPKCNRQIWWKRGIHSFFPTKITTAEYVWSSEFPVDPDTGEICVVSPEAMEAMDEEGTFVAFTRAQQRTAGIKQSFFQKYGVFIAIGVALLGFAFLWMQTRGLNSSITMLANYYKELANKVPK